ncbi:hypothetical protein [Bradyrhizobium mercantei]|uniref:hypothetical protein n=1 Tax=Bradyrhizobium mercantei TaxID=1904807 RepID=UPI0011776323|nr:hypothetical protein [Bradyrhizobium mercantei]
MSEVVVPVMLQVIFAKTSQAIVLTFDFRWRRDWYDTCCSSAMSVTDGELPTFVPDEIWRKTNDVAFAAHSQCRDHFMAHAHAKLRSKLPSVQLRSGID